MVSFSFSLNIDLSRLYWEQVAALFLIDEVYLILRYELDRGDSQAYDTS